MFGRMRVIAVLAVVGSGAVGVGLAMASASTSATGWTPLTGALPNTAAAASASAASGLRGRDVVTIRRIWHPTVVQQIDLPPTGASPGDEVVFGGPLFDPTNTKQLGFLSGHCTSTNPAFRALAECELTAVPTAHGPSLANGNQITAQGWNDDTPLPFKQAITGGTGIYATARGQIIATPGARFSVVFQLVQ